MSYQIPFSLWKDDEEYLTKSVANLGRAFADLLSKDRPDLLIILGDRYEIMAPVFAAVMQRIPLRIFMVVRRQEELWITKFGMQLHN